MAKRVRLGTIPPFRFRPARAVIDPSEAAPGRDTEP
jgi:hypothetical protein